MKIEDQWQGRGGIRALCCFYGRTKFEFGGGMGISRQLTSHGVVYCWQVTMLRSELWCGCVELKPLDRAEYGAAGAFTNIITWARDAEEFRSKADTIATSLKMYVAQTEKVEPVGDYSDEWPEEFEDMVRRAESNPNAIIYGTFHNYPHDQA